MIIIEQTNTGFSAYSPDVQGCVTTGVTPEETIQDMEEALSFHLEGLQLEGETIPAPSSIPAYVEPTVA